MWPYLIRRLLLLPLTLFCIVMVNFVIVNLAPGDPTSITEISQEGAARKAGSAVAFGSDDRYLQFREHYGLTLPVLFNTWPFLTMKDAKRSLWQLVHWNDGNGEMAVKDYDALRIRFGDQARFVMSELINVIEDEKELMPMREMAVRFFVRGGTQQAHTGPYITEKEKKENKKIARDNLLLQNLAKLPVGLDEQVEGFTTWYQENKNIYHYEPTWEEKVWSFFFETRFCRYLSRVLTLDFGTLRNDQNKTVIQEVTRRFKYSLTLAVIPMLLTFVLCQVFGFTMAYTRGRWPDLVLNVCCLMLYAVPVFVVAPFLIEKVAMNHTFPFTGIPIPFSGFTSSEPVYEKMTSWQRLWDTLRHLCLPLIAVMYGGLAAQSRLSRTAVLEVLRQDYVRTAQAKGVGPGGVMVKHVGRNAAITIVTSIAGSLGIVLGGSLIVETLFEINGFGKFFYDAVINRDYNVIMFSALAGAFLTLVGYLVADIAYTVLDPRVTLD